MLPVGVAKRLRRSSPWSPSKSSEPWEFCDSEPSPGESSGAVLQPHSVNSAALESDNEKQVNLEMSLRLCMFRLLLPFTASERSLGGSESERKRRQTQRTSRASRRNLRMNERRNHLAEDVPVPVVVAIVVVVLVVARREDRVIGAIEVEAIWRECTARRRRRWHDVATTVAGEVEAAERLARVERIGLRALPQTQLRLCRIPSAASNPVDRLAGRGEKHSVEGALLQRPIRQLIGSGGQRAAGSAHRYGNRHVVH